MSATPGRPSARGRPRRSTIVGNLAKDRTSFVGRAEDLRELKSALGRSRLVTLVGPGGIGKSRLARELAGQIAAIFPGGVWLVELAAVSTPDAVAPTVARALGIFEHGSRPLDAQIAGAVQSHALLILDNCEHVIASSAAVAGALLAGSPNLRILATSREPLEISGETTFAVAALPVPEAPDDVALNTYDRFAGLQLFVERVLARDRTFRVTEENLPLIASVGAGVGGMPLALELAAGRASRMGLLALADQIEEQLGFEDLHRDVPERHRSMRAALAASYEPLAPEEQELWKRLSIFPSGASLAAMRTFCAYGSLERDAVDTALEGLIERSIISLDVSAPDSRYRMLEPVRLFGLEQARLAGEEQTLRQAHLEWCSTLIPADVWLTGSEQLRWVRVFQAEHANITAALDYCLTEPRRPELVGAGLRLFAATFLFWNLSGGWYRERRHYAEALLEASTARSRTRTTVLFAAGFASWYDWQVAEPWFKELQGTAGRDRLGQGFAHHGLGYCALMAESYDRAITLLERACGLLAEAAAIVPLAQARYGLSQAHAHGNHDYANARSAIEPNLTLVAPDDIWNRAMTHSQLGLFEWRQGAWDDAESHLLQALELQLELGHPFGRAASLEYLAWVAVAKDEPARAAQLLGYAESLLERIGVGLVTGLVGEHDKAIRLVRDRLGPDRYRTLSQAGALMDQAEIARLARRQPTAHDDEEGSQPLTARELEVAELIAKGATNYQISLELLIAYETVKTHVRSILHKLGFESRVQIAAWYGTRDQIPSEDLGSSNV